MALFLAAILFVLSFLAGMMGLGVAFITTPVLGLLGFDLKDTIMPLALWLNGLTAISSAVAYTRARMVDWRTAIPLLLITAITAPLGVVFLQFFPVTVIWWLYAALLVFLAWRMAFPGKPQDDTKQAEITDATRAKGGIISAGIGVVAGILGVGPGFLMVPTLVILGMTTRIAAATKSVIVTVPSFTAFFMHLSTMGHLVGAVLVLVFSGLLAMAGLGAAFLFVPLFYYLGVPLAEATPTALLLNTVSLLFATINYWRGGLMEVQMAAGTRTCGVDLKSCEHDFLTESWYSSSCQSSIGEKNRTKPMRS